MDSWLFDGVIDDFFLEGGSAVVDHCLGFLADGNVCAVPQRNHQKVNPSLPIAQVHVELDQRLGLVLDADWLDCGSVAADLSKGELGFNDADLRRY